MTKFDVIFDFVIGGGYISDGMNFQPVTELSMYFAEEKSGSKVSGLWSLKMVNCWPIACQNKESLQKCTRVPDQMCNEIEFGKD